MRCKLKIKYMNTQFKVGDRVNLISKYNVEGLCTIVEVDDEEPMYCVAIDSSQNYWVNSDSIVKAQDTPPTPKWLPIDRDNLPSGKVAAMHIKERDLVFTGTLEVDDFSIITMEITKGAWVSGFTHYIPLTDLLNLPIAE